MDRRAAVVRRRLRRSRTDEAEAAAHRTVLAVALTNSLLNLHCFFIKRRWSARSHRRSTCGGRGAALGEAQGTFLEDIEEIKLIQLRDKTLEEIQGL